jgi:hypothetical protein
MSRKCFGDSLNLVELGRAAAAAEASNIRMPLSCSAAAASLSKAMTTCLAFMLLQNAAQLRAHFYIRQQ